MPPHSPRTDHNRRITDHLHPAIYRALIGLAVWLVISVWAFFDTGYYTVVNLAVVTGLISIAVMLPFLIWRTSVRNGGSLDDPSEHERLRDWVHNEFKVWTGPINGAEAATQVLLPIAAVCIGMTVFGIVLHLSIPLTG